MTQQNLNNILNELINFQDVVEEKDKIIATLTKRVAELEEKLSTFNLDTPVEHRNYSKFSYKSHKKNFSKLVVKRKNGTLVEGKNSADVFFNAVIEADPLKVRQLNIVRGKLNIVSNVLDAKYGKSQKPTGNGWYINTHSPTDLKKQMLDEINEKLGLGITVSVVKK